MIDPYTPPKTQEIDDEKNIKGGFFASNDSNALDCMGAWISINKRYIRFKYLPAKSRNLVLIIFCVAVVLLIPFSALGGLGAIIVYAIINSVIRSMHGSKVEFSIDDEELLIDTRRRTIGLRQIQNMKPVFLGSKVPKDVLNTLKEDFSYTETTIKKGRKLGYQSIAVGVWIVGFILGILIHLNWY